MNPYDDVVRVALLVSSAFEQAQIEYVLGGSLATSIQGEPRATRDIDFAVRMSEAQVSQLVAALGADFDVDERALTEALRSGRSTNIFFIPEVTKVDLFFRGAAEFDRSEFSRRVRHELPAGGSLYAATAEDNLLRKLSWFQLGGEVSDLQWRDILGLLRAGRPVDLSYLRLWAPKLGVEALLDRALAAKGG